MLEEGAEEGQFIVEDDDGLTVLFVADGDAVLIGFGFCQFVHDGRAQAGVGESHGGDQVEGGGVDHAQSFFGGEVSSGDHGRTHVGTALLWPAARPGLRGPPAGGRQGRLRAVRPTEGRCPP